MNTKFGAKKYKEEAIKYPTVVKCYVCILIQCCYKLAVQNRSERIGFTFSIAKH